MAEQKVYIFTDDITYDPDPPLVKPLDTVRFIMDGREDTVVVNFAEGNPFAQNNFELDGSQLTLSAKSATVVSNVTARRYSFFVIPDEGEPRPLSEDPEMGKDPHKGPFSEPPGTLSGDLEVVTDPPHDDDDK